VPSPPASLTADPTYRQPTPPIPLATGPDPTHHRRPTPPGLLTAGPARRSHGRRSPAGHPPSSLSLPATGPIGSPPTLSRLVHVSAEPRHDRLARPARTVT